MRFQKKFKRKRIRSSFAIAFVFVSFFLVIILLICVAVVSTTTTLTTNTNTDIPNLQHERPSTPKRVVNGRNGTNQFNKSPTDPSPNDANQHQQPNTKMKSIAERPNKTKSDKHQKPKIPATTTTTTIPATPNYHIVFSTDCSKYQKWQTYLLFYSAYKVNQRGTVTRIVSGCTEDEQQIELKFHSDISRHMSPNFKVHFTPQYSKLNDATTKAYPYFNKPFGLLHWMDHSKETIREDDVVILMDPDQLLTKPITHEFRDPLSNLWIGTHPKTIVTHGSPFAQKYGYHHSWKKLNMTRVTGVDTTPAQSVSNQDAKDHYSVGPPYLATARDMHRLARTWAEFVPRAYDDHPKLMAEMFAYSIAAAHLGLPHQIVRSLMVSDVDPGGGPGTFNPEGWWLVNNIEKGDICSPTVADDYILPAVVHYCQSYALGKHFFGKRRIPHDIFSCGSPLLASPPLDIMTKYTQYVPPSRMYGSTTKLKGNAVKQHAFMVCILTRLLNEASLFYQSKNCDHPKKANEVLDLWTLEVVKK